MSSAVSVSETVADDEDWPVSSSSRFSDAVWLLDARGASKYEPPKYRVINWAIPLPGGTAFTDPAYATQLRTCKLLFQRLQHQPAEGRRRWRSSTLRNAHSALRVLMPWMVAHGYRRFADLDDRTTRMFAAHLRQRKGRRGTLTPSGLVHHLSLLVALYEHRNELPDAPRIHPLGGEAGSAFAGFNGVTKRQSPTFPTTSQHIPSVRHSPG